jgi:2'-hydroxyisoflavone reductase
VGTGRLPGEPAGSRLATHADLAPARGAYCGFLRRSNAKALAAGLTFRPLAVTAKDTLDWHKTRPEAERTATLQGAIAGIPPEKEAEVLAAWKAKT